MSSYPSVQNQLQKAFFDQFPSPVFIVAAGTLKIVTANRAALLFYGLSQEEVAALYFPDVHPSAQIEWSQQLQHLANKVGSSITQSFIVNGKQKRVKIAAATLFCEGNHFYQVMVTKAGKQSGSTQPAIALSCALPSKKPGFREGHFCKMADTSPSMVKKQPAELSNDDINNQEFTIVDKQTGRKNSGRIVSEKEQMDNKIRMLASLVKQSADVLTAADLEFKPITWNKAAETVYGLTSEQVIGKNIRDFINLSYKDATQEEVRLHIRERGEWRGEMSFIRPTDHKSVTLLIHFKLMRDEDGTPAGYVISGTDITQLKETELKLKESEMRFGEVADSAPVMIWMSDEQNKTTYVNKTWMRFTGVDTTELTSIGWSGLVHPDDISEALKLFNSGFQQRLPITLTYRLRQQSGSYQWVQDTGTPRLLQDGTFCGYIGSVVDIHDTKLREEQLHYQADILKNVSDVIIVTDLQHHVLSWNSVAEQTFGIAAADITGKYLYKQVRFDFGMTPQQVMDGFLTDGIWKGEVSFINKKGEKKYLLFITSYLVDAVGNKTAIIGVGRDVTDRKQAEEKLRKSELFYRNLIADSLDGMILTDVTGSITFVSPSIKHILGFKIEEVLGKNAFQFVHPDDQGLALQSFQREVEENPQTKFIIVRLLMQNGEWLWCSVRGHNLLHNPYIGSIVIYFHDDSQRKKATEALKESEQRFRTLIRDLSLGVLMYDSTLNLITANKTAEKVMNMFNPTHLPYREWVQSLQMIHENGSSFLPEEYPLAKAFHTRQTVKDVVIGCIKKESDYIGWFLFNAEPVLDEGGKILHVIVSFVDITERKKLEQKLLDEKVAQQKLLTQATIDAQEKERREIGKELHDNIGQQLTTTKLYLDLAKSTADDRTAEMVCLGLKSISDVINEVRTVSHALVPPTLGDLGLIESIYELIETIIFTQQALQIELDALYFEEDIVPENQKMMLFRIIQEQLNNIVKYAQATAVTITLKHEKQHLTLHIKDNGKGFDVKKVRKGVGLSNIKSRAELLGGKAEVLSSAGSGCAVKVIIPAAQQPQL